MKIKNIRLSLFRHKFKLLRFKLISFMGLSIACIVSAHLLLAPTPAMAQNKTAKPNILVIFGDDIGYWNLSYNNRGMMGYRTPNIDRIAREEITFKDY